MFKLIGLAGRAGSGKNALADYISATGDYRQDAFAAPIKKGLAQILGISIGRLEELKNSGAIDATLAKSYREMMQTLGTEWGRNIVNSDIWTLLARGRILANNPVVTIMTDVRFDNEADLVHQMGGVIVYIDRPIAMCRQVEKHVSENSLSKKNIDYTIYNNTNNLRDLQASWDNLTYLLYK